MQELQSLMSESVSGVAFVQDYVEFHFDGKILRALNPPTLKRGGKVFRFPEEGSRDAFCSLIGETVERIEVGDFPAIGVAFSGSSDLSISLSRIDSTGPEAAHFVPGSNQPIVVWESR